MLKCSKIITSVILLPRAETDVPRKFKAPSEERLPIGSKATESRS